MLKTEEKEIQSTQLRFAKQIMQPGQNLDQTDIFKTTVIMVLLSLYSPGRPKENASSQCRIQRCLRLLKMGGSQASVYVDQKQIWIWRQVTQEFHLRLNVILHTA
jgi:hypothetical protein